MLHKTTRWGFNNQKNQPNMMLYAALPKRMAGAPQISKV